MGAGLHRAAVGKGAEEEQVGIEARRDDGGVDVGVPVLTLCSSRSRLGRPYSPDADTADTVLDVAQIRHWTPRLGEQVTVQAIRNARHDVFLSLQPARDEALEITVDWLSALDN